MHQLGPAGKRLVSGEGKITKKVLKRGTIRGTFTEVLQHDMGHRESPGFLRMGAFGHRNLRPGVSDCGNAFDFGARQGRILTRELKEELHSHRYEAAAQKYLREIPVIMPEDDDTFKSSVLPSFQIGSIIPNFPELPQSGLWPIRAPGNPIGYQTIQSPAKKTPPTEHR